MTAAVPERSRPNLPFSQLLTLFSTPVTYLALDRFVRRRPRADAQARPEYPVLAG